MLPHAVAPPTVPSPGSNPSASLLFDPQQPQRFRAPPQSPPPLPPPQPAVVPSIIHSSPSASLYHTRVDTQQNSNTLTATPVAYTSSPSRTTESSLMHSVHSNSPAPLASIDVKSVAELVRQLAASRHTARQLQQRVQQFAASSLLASVQSGSAPPQQAITPPPDRQHTTHETSSPAAVSEARLHSVNASRMPSASVLPTEEASRREKSPAVTREPETRRPSSPSNVKARRRTLTRTASPASTDDSSTTSSGSGSSRVASFTRSTSAASSIAPRHSRTSSHRTSAASGASSSTSRGTHSRRIEEKGKRPPQRHPPRSRFRRSRTHAATHRPRSSSRVSERIKDREQEKRQGGVRNTASERVEKQQRQNHRKDKAHSHHHNTQHTKRVLRDVSRPKGRERTRHGLDDDVPPARSGSSKPHTSTAKPAGRSMSSAHHRYTGREGLTALSEQRQREQESKELARARRWQKRYYNLLSKYTSETELRAAELADIHDLIEFMSWEQDRSRHRHDGQQRSAHVERPDALPEEKVIHDVKASAARKGLEGSLQVMLSASSTPLSSPYERGGATVDASLDILPPQVTPSKDMEHEDGEARRQGVDFGQTTPPKGSAAAAQSASAEANNSTYVSALRREAEVWRQRCMELLAQPPPPPPPQQKSITTEGTFHAEPDAPMGAPRTQHDAPPRPQHPKDLVRSGNTSVACGKWGEDYGTFRECEANGAEMAQREDPQRRQDPRELREGIASPSSSLFATPAPPLPHPPRPVHGRHPRQEVSHHLVASAPSSRTPSRSTRSHISVLQQSATQVVPHNAVTTTTISAPVHPYAPLPAFLKFRHMSGAAAALAAASRQDVLSAVTHTSRRHQRAEEDEEPDSTAHARRQDRSPRLPSPQRPALFVGVPGYGQRPCEPTLPMDADESAWREVSAMAPPPHARADATPWLFPSPVPSQYESPSHTYPSPSHLPDYYESDRRHHPSHHGDAGGARGRTVADFSLAQPLWDSHHASLHPSPSHPGAVPFPYHGEPNTTCFYPTPLQSPLTHLYPASSSSSPYPPALLHTPSATATPAVEFVVAREQLERDIRRHDQLLAAIGKLQKTAAEHASHRVV